MAQQEKSEKGNKERQGQEFVRAIVSCENRKKNENTTRTTRKFAALYTLSIYSGIKANGSVCVCV